MVSEHNNLPQLRDEYALSGFQKEDHTDSAHYVKQYALAYKQSLVVHTRIRELACANSQFLSAFINSYGFVMAFMLILFALALSGVSLF